MVPPGGNLVVRPVYGTVLSHKRGQSSQPHCCRGRAVFGNDQGASPVYGTRTPLVDGPGTRPVDGTESWQFLPFSESHAMVWNVYLMYVHFRKVSTHNPLHPLLRRFQNCIWHSRWESMPKPHKILTRRWFNPPCASVLCLCHVAGHVTCVPCGCVAVDVPRVDLMNNELCMF